MTDLITSPLARYTSTQSAFSAVRIRSAKRSTKRSKSWVCATSRERSTSSRTVLSRCASSPYVRLTATASAQMRASPSRASAWREKSRSPASLSSIAPTSSPWSTMGAHASERQPRRCSASLARRSSRPSDAWMQVTPAVTGSPSTGIQSLVAQTAPWRPGSRSPSFIGDGEAQAVAVGEIDVAAGSSGEGAQRARRLSGNGVRVLDHQRHETETGLHDGAQVLGLAAQRREVARLRGALALVLREQREDVLGEVPAVAAGAAVGGDAAHVGPPPHRVRADAERVRDVADAQPHELGPLSHRRHGLPRSARTIPPYIGSIGERA